MEKDFVFGVHAVAASVEAGKEIDKIFVQHGEVSEGIKDVLKQAHRLKIPCVRVPSEKLHRITRKNHQGIIAFLSTVQYASLDHIIQEAYASGGDPLIILLDRITDVRNFGAIARTAECAGVSGIVIPARGGAMINNDAMKTSAGALNYIPVCREGRLTDTIKYLADNGIATIAATEKAAGDLYKQDFKRPVAVVLGSEEDGVSPEILQMCEGRFQIPQRGHTESLNVSVSAAITIYEAIRQRMM